MDFLFDLKPILLIVQEILQKSQYKKMSQKNRNP